MKQLLSLPPHLVDCFHEITGLPRDQWFCTSDPVGHRLGSGGGTAWLLQQACEEEMRSATGTAADKVPTDPQTAIASWLPRDKRILIHAGGQSRRVPAYAPSGKVLTPIPVFRWERGQRLSQTLLDLQVPLYQKIMRQAPDGLHTMVVSGDVYIRSTRQLQPIPEADVVCYGLWLDAETASHHGVFVSARNEPSALKCMLQKPSVEQLQTLLQDHFYLTDIGIWLLSDRAVSMLMARSTRNGALHDYDLYGEFGLALGSEPTAPDPELSTLSVAVLPLPGGEFYHFGTSRELISSMVAIQNRERDQRKIMHLDAKPHPAMFTQNAQVDYRLTAENTNVWIENSHVGADWQLSRDHIITGVPRNHFSVNLSPGRCIDVVPVGDKGFAVRPYHIDDRFAGDAQLAKRFPLVDSVEAIGRVLATWPADDDLSGSIPDDIGRWELLSADDISHRANLQRLMAQRRDFRRHDWEMLARNWQRSVFYQLDLEDAAAQFREQNIPQPEPLPASAPLLTRIHDAMFRNDDATAFSLLRHGLTEQALQERQQPHMSVMPDQIVWSRSPVRIDVAGGWTDTPPYCLMEGGSVVNLAIELNGQPPLQAYVKPCREPHIILRSIDMGAAEVVDTYEQLADFHHVGSPFSIPKAALALAGFLPRFSATPYATLRDQLDAFGCGIELTLLSAIPAGSGLGTSSILASTVLAALSDFCGLAWDKNTLGRRTLVLEQLLTTGGGWQDQYGGILQGVKMLSTDSGFEQNPVVKWLPHDLFTLPEYSACHLLYYTGITRTAKAILAEIVRRMFLNQHDELRLLREMKDHADDMYDAIQRADFLRVGALVRKTWEQNRLIDSGTNPPAVAAITQLIDDYCLGYKLGGAGGGGYLYMIAKDAEAAARIRTTLEQHRPNANARFVDMTLSLKGLQVSRS